MFEFISYVRSELFQRIFITVNKFIPPTVAIIYESI